MNIIVILKGDLQKPQDIEISAVEDYGVLQTKKDTSVLLIVANVRFANANVEEASDARIDHEKELRRDKMILDNVFISMDIDDKRLHVSTIQAWAPEAEEMMKAHVRNRSQKYQAEAESAAICEKWNELYPKDKVTLDTVGSKLMEKGTNPAAFSKDNFIEATTTKEAIYVELELANVSSI